MKEWFEQLAPRERLLVMVAGVLVGITIIVTLGIRPIINQTSRGHELVDDKQALLAELSQVAQRLGPQGAGTQSAGLGSTQSLVVLVDQTTRTNGLAPYLKRNQPDGASSIRLRFENAPFDNLVEWLGQLQSQYGLSATSANIDVAAEPGRVSCNLTISRSGV